MEFRGLSVDAQRAYGSYNRREINVETRMDTIFFILANQIDDRA